MKNLFNCSIYIHINKINGKVYIGWSKNPKVRWANGRGYKGCPHFYAAIQKYGWDNFLHIIIRTGLSEKEAKELECQWIYLFRADDNRFGYNITKGGDGWNRGADCYNREVINRKQRENYWKNRDDRRAKDKIRRERNKEEYNKKALQYYHDNNEAIKQKSRENYQTNREDILRKRKEYREQFYKTHGMYPSRWYKLKKQQAEQLL